MRAVGLFSIVLGGLLCAVSARADLSISLSQSIQNSARGREIVFSGTLTNTSATDKLFLNDIAATLGGASATNLALKPNSFFSNVPGILLPNETYSNSELFRISLKDIAPAGDYAGGITVRGGADIFANTDLASGSFTVLSPDVSIVTTDASASEVGPDPGVFTISRSGSTPVNLPVFFTISGTAVNGVAYNAITAAVTIPAGSNSATVTISPIPNNTAEGDRSVILSLGISSTYNLGTPLNNSLTIHDKPADAWRFDNFGANANDPAAADASDWDGDGLRNLLEFALNSDPKSGNLDALPRVTIANDYLTLTFVPNPAATDVAYIVKGSIDLQIWDAAQVEEVNVINPNPPGLRTFRYKVPISQVNPAFIRLQVERTDN